jgi:hypothetical protein
VERLKPATLYAIFTWARKKGLIVFIDTDGHIKIFPKTNKAWQTLEQMLFGRHPEAKMYLIQTHLEGEE